MPKATVIPAPVPATQSLETVREAARGCRACPLWQTGTQTVFGEGARSARLMFVGEDRARELSLFIADLRSVLRARDSP